MIFHDLTEKEFFLFLGMFAICTLLFVVLATSGHLFLGIICFQGTWYYVIVDFVRLLKRTKGEK